MLHVDYTSERSEMARRKTPQTTVDYINPGDLGLLRYLALQAIKNPNTKWRHNGQGMLQGYLYEGTENEARIHIWHDALRKPGIIDNGLIHDHRFDMRSFIILGGIAHNEIRLTDTEEGALFGGYIMEITNARKAKEKTGSSYHMDPQKTGEYVQVRKIPFHIRNQVYTFPRFRFHKAFTIPETTVSIVLKSRQVNVKARLLDQPENGDLINSFDGTLSQPEFQHILDDTAVQLRSAISSPASSGEKL